MLHIVTGFVVVLVQAVAGDGVRDDAAFCQRIVVRALEKMLRGMRIGHQLRPMLGQFRAKVAAVESCEPEFIGLYGGIGPPDHFKFQVGHNAGQRHGRMLQEILVALSAGFFAPEKSKDYRPLWMFLPGKSSRQLQDGDAAGSVVIGAVVYAVAVYRLSDAQVVHVRAQQDDLVFQFGITARKNSKNVAGVPLQRSWNSSWQNSKNVAGVPLLASAVELEYTGHILNVTAMVT